MKNIEMNMRKRNKAHSVSDNPWRARNKESPNLPNFFIYKVKNKYFTNLTVIAYQLN